MKIKRGVLLSLIATFLSVSSLLVLTSGTSFADTDLTWDGTDCNSGGSCNWSDPGNWSGASFTNGDFPSSSSLEVIFPNSTLSNSPVVDTADIVDGIEFTGNISGNIALPINLSAGLTVNSSISQDSTDTTTNDSIGGSSSAETITLGGNVTVTINAGITLTNTDGTDTDAVALAGNSLTVNNTSSSQGIFDNSDDISGTGTVNYDLTNNEAAAVQLYASSTYSGTTNVEAGDVDEIDVSGFGSSAIVVSTGAGIDFDDPSSTVSNAIKVEGTTNNSPVTSLDFGNSPTNLTSQNFPNITLEGDTRFGNDTVSPNFMTINLAGINSNGYCIEYLGGNDNGTEAGAGFENGPSYCDFTTSSSTPTTKAPKTPDTGFGLVGSHSQLAIVGAATISIGLILTSIVFGKFGKINLRRR